jgi:hypothetical protein
MTRTVSKRPVAIVAVGLLLGLAPLCFTSAATAAMRGDSPEARRACSSDAYRLCDRFIPNERQTAACLRHNRRHLSGECRRFIR